MSFDRNTIDPLSTDAAELPQQQMLDDGVMDSIWPDRPLMWLSGFWILLYIIRPWEHLIPILGDLRFERVFCMSVLGYAALRGAFRIEFSRPFLAILVLFAALVVTGIMGLDPSRAWDGGVYKMIVHIAMFVIIFSSVRRTEDLLFLCVAYVFAMGLYLGKSEWEYFIYNRHSYSMGVPRLVGIDLTYRHPNGVGASTVLSLPFWYVLWQYRSRIRDSTLAYRSLLFRGIQIYPVLAVTAVLLTNSRGAMLGCVLFAVMAALGASGGAKKIGRLMALMLVLAAFFYAVMPQTQRERLSTLWNAEAGPTNAKHSADTRTDGAKAGWEMFNRFPITGVGTGNFQAYRPTIDGSDQVAHNVYGQTVGEHGIIGAAALLFLVFATFSSLRTTRKLASSCPTEKSELLDRVAFACGQSLVLLLFFGLASSNLERFNWYWLAAMAASALAIARELVAEFEYQQVEEEFE